MLHGVVLSGLRDVPPTIRGRTDAQAVDARIWDVATGENLETLRGDTAVASTALSPDARLAVTGTDKTARIWDARTGRTLDETNQPIHRTRRTQASCGERLG